MITQDLQEFYFALKPNSPILSIDYGQKKWGIAVSNQVLTVSMPINILSQSSFELKMEALSQIIEKYIVTGIVIGWPINMDGTSGPQSVLVMEFAKKINNSMNLPIYLQDERLTSKAADSVLKAIGMKRMQRNSLDDAVAASMILETVLQSIRNNFKNH